MEFIYSAKIKKDEDGFFLVTFRDLPYGATDGQSVDEALAEAVDCLDEVIAGCIMDGLDLPIPSPHETGEYSIRLSAQMAAKAALYLAFKKTSITKSELARQLDTDPREVRRMLDPKHPTKLPRIEEALAVMGFRLGVSMMEVVAA